MGLKIKAMAAASMLALAGGLAGSANAAVFLAFQQNGGAIVQKGVDAELVSFAGAFGNFEVNVYSGTDGVAPQLMGTSGHTRNTKGGNAGRLDVYVTVTDLMGPPSSFESSFAVNVLPKRWTVQHRTYANDNNGLWGIGGTLLSSKTFGGIGVFEHTGTANLDDGPYSLTARYTITAPTHGEVLSNISITAVPEPTTWALMIMGFGAAGAILRRRAAAVAA